MCVAPVTVGRWALVAAGRSWSQDVPDFALVAGVPARFVRWVGRAGVPLVPAATARFRCPQTGAMYAETDGTLREEVTMIPAAKPLIGDEERAASTGCCAAG